MLQSMIALIKRVKQLLATEWCNGLSFDPVMIAHPYNWDYLFENLKERDEWCKENLNGRYEFRYKCFAFESMEDVVAFKLRWT